MPDATVRTGQFSALERAALAALTARLLTPYRGVHVFEYRTTQYWRIAVLIERSRLRVRDFDGRIEFVSTGARLLDLRSSRALELHHDSANVVWIDPSDQSGLIGTAIGHAITIRDVETGRRDPYFVGIAAPGRAPGGRRPIRQP